MKLTDEQHEKLSVLVERYWKTAQDKLGLPKDIDSPDIHMKQSGLSAGSAQRMGNRFRVTFNEPMAALNWDKFQDCYDCTVGHEVAHCVAFVLYPGVKPHGREWKSIMKALGLNPNSRTHDFSTDGIKARRHRKWTWSASCGCKWVVKTGKHNELLRRVRDAGTSQYRCRKHREYFNPPKTVKVPEEWKLLKFINPGNGLWSVETNGAKYRVSRKCEGYYACDTMDQVRVVIDKLSRQVNQYSQAAKR